MDVFELRNALIKDYDSYINSFIHILDNRIRSFVDQKLKDGLLWPDPLISLNPSFKPGHTIDELIDEGILHKSCKDIFRRKKTKGDYGSPLQLHQHQEDAIRTARAGKNYVLTTGTGSGKSLAYIVPIVDYVLRNGSGKGIKAIIVYPMNALANSQRGELEKFLTYGFPDGKSLVRFERYTGQESDEEKNRIMSNPPDILLTNYMMLELILTRPEEQETLVHSAKGLRFLVLDELHTYRGRQGADVALLIRRVRNALDAQEMLCIGTSATLSTAGSLEDQKVEVASVASMLFGGKVLPENVIGETLIRATEEWDFTDPDNIKKLAARAAEKPFSSPKEYSLFRKDILAGWVESTLGLSMDSVSGRLVRAKPRSIFGENGSASELSQLTGLPESQCASVIMQTLMQGYDILNPSNGLPCFAFRLHQFISRGDTVYTTLEKEEERYLTVNAQQYVPDNRGKILLPLTFCRECGQEYYTVYYKKGKEGGPDVYLPRDFSDLGDEEVGEPGYLYFSSNNSWPDEIEKMTERIPEDWLEEFNGTIRVKPGFKKHLPEPVELNTLGESCSGGLKAHYFASPFRFCLNCGVTYGIRQTSDYAKLTTLSSGGRSTDTTILSLSLVRQLKGMENLPKEARKLLSFTDNRQDASLQAGHFNDFIEIGLLRSALYKAVKDAGDEGISHEILTQRLYKALNLTAEEYAQAPESIGPIRIQNEKALREVLGYRIYRDLKRGWRITSPNLEQCGLLEICYLGLDEVCETDLLWKDTHIALRTANAKTRFQVCKTILDFMRRELAIKVSYLDQTHQETIRQQSNQRLKSPWALEEEEKMEYSSILFPRSKRNGEDSGGYRFVSPRGGYGQYLRRITTFPNFHEKIRMDDVEEIIQDIFATLCRGGLVEVALEAHHEGDVSGYQLPASVMIWKVGDGLKPFHDPIRNPRQAVDGGETNSFFINFYQVVAANLHGYEAHEHTAQVPASIREQREIRFKSADLPILYCSPTMELGVDIADLNAVNMRNVPPTPANYAQRSGRAGRGGQPALVFTYCTQGSPHDHYYFKRPELMVFGAVTPPRLDLSNEALIRSHVHAVWLAETGQSLKSSLKDLLDLTGTDPTLEIQEQIKIFLSTEQARKKALHRTKAILSTIENDLSKTDWYNETWAEKTIDQALMSFDHACDRWRGLYQAAKGQQRAQQKIIDDMSKSAEDRNTARRLRQEAESQIELLTDSKNVAQSDFYSYRYFASEGFLPGYSFPRLPLSAYIPARRVKGERDEFLSRPRFLAISEFGPRAIVYHEGSRYVIHKVNLPVSEDGNGLTTNRAKKCPQCGYFHLITKGDGPDLCERCGADLGLPLIDLFRLTNVSTRRRDRISSDEEERMRQGFELHTGLHFPTDQLGNLAAHTGELFCDDKKIARITYAGQATIFRINVGWRRRADKDHLGFWLDTERGYWERQSEDDGDPQDPMSRQKKLVIPFVEDTKNCLLFEPEDDLSKGQMASLQAALKRAIQVRYQLEDNELAAEPLPDPDRRKMILFYESAEGGAGVLSRLLENPAAFGEVARAALQICHFNSVDGSDELHAPNVHEKCEAACYDCLMSYYNQADHRLLDRLSIRDYLLNLAASSAQISPTTATHFDHLQQLRNLCQSDYERSWLDFLEKHQYNLPTHAQKLVEDCNTRPDFLYLTKDSQYAIYIDGYHHLFPDRQARDRDQESCMEDMGFTVLRFGIKDDWEKLCCQYPSLFGIYKN